MIATKFYIRHREGYPETELGDYARRGFWTLGVETSRFEWVDDIDLIEDLGPTVGICGYIGDVHRGLKKLNKNIPANVDYPDALQDFFGRKIWRGTLWEVRSSISKLFVKPLEHKAFTGFVWNNDIESRRKIVTHSDDCIVWISEPVEFVSEHRSFILNDEIIDCRRYKGDWSKAPDKNILETATAAMAKYAPRAYILDWGVTSNNETILVEMNEGFSFGGYGLHPVDYAKMLSARWNELVK